MTDSSVVSSQYWEARASRFATQGSGLAAVCSYGMPAFYNTCIDVCQRLALRKWIQVTPGMEVLDVGCGVGRWSVDMAARGARVTGVDLSETMLVEARRRAEEAGVAARCRFMQQDLAALDTGRQYSLVLGVTVLQHILDPARLAEAVSRLADHLHPGGRMVLLEVAPTRSNERCDTPAFRARTLDTYLDLLRVNGLILRTLTGVDPMPLRILLLPYYQRLPRPLATAGLAAATALSLPFEVALGRRLVTPSWHKVFVVERPRKAAGEEPRA
jgi:2-polyprenyl-3-methyl-5-hydroxy-6-metoxy-1,4-benzoquinol methylase